MISYQSDPELLTCIFQGRYDTATTAKIDQEIISKVQQITVPVIFDLKDVDFVASAFLRILLQVAKTLGKERFKIVGVNPAILKVLKISGFDKIMAIESQG